MINHWLKIRGTNKYAAGLASSMEPLQRLTRRQVDALQAIQRRETPSAGVSLNAIAEALDVTPPSALGHLTASENLGLIVRFRGKSRLSAKGRETLREYQRHHRIAESLFGRLGLSSRDVCDAAREVDLALSHETIDRLCEVEQHPKLCPHGEPIPPCASQPGPAGG